MSMIIGILIIFGFHLVRKNIFAYVFYVLTIVFLYSRFFIQFIDGDFSVGGEEWIFPGVAADAISLYQFYFLTFLIALLLAATFSKPLKIPAGLIFDASKFLKVLIIIIFFAGAYRGYLYTILLIEGGYLATVDYVPPLLLSLLTGSFIKPLALLFMILYYRTKNKNWRNLFFIYCLILVFSWQRSDVVTLMIVFWCLSFIYYNKNSSVLNIRIFLGPLLIFALGFLIFFVREDAMVQIDSRIILDLIWAAGISVNPGLYIAERFAEFLPSDVWGFPITYISCSVGRLFLDLCNTDARLSVPGFFLEKITNSIGVDSNGSFVGLGGNLIASLIVASKFTGHFEFDLFLFFFFALGYCLLCIYLFNRGSGGVTALLIVSELLLASRSSIDGSIPALHQLIVALILDYIIVLRSKRLEARG